MSLSTRELTEITRSNRSDRRPVVFVHGLWLLAGSWDPWRARFEEAGYAAVAPGWPDDPESVEEAHHHPEVFAHKRVEQITEHFADVCRQLRFRPAVVGHSFGGLVTERLAGMGLAAASVAISPAPFRGVLPLPIAALRSALPVLRNPANYGRAVALTYEQFRFAFANAVSEEEARRLYEAYAVAGAGTPLFQAATANVNPWSHVTVDTRNPRRGPLLILSGEKDHTVPGAMARAAYARQRRNPGLTEFREIPGRGHALTIDSGWREVADVSLGFLAVHAPARPDAAEEARVFPRFGESAQPSL